MKLIRDLILLTGLLVFSIFAMLINLSFFSDDSSLESVDQQEILLKKPLKPIKNQIGKQFFKANCAACHNRNMQDGLVGPALGDVRQRWENNDVSIYDFIRNSQAVIAGGNKYAKELFIKWGAEMPAFSNLKNEEIDTILNYIDEMSIR
jgi:mono/diheme cytochrome c family protein